MKLIADIENNSVVILNPDGTVFNQGTFASLAEIISSKTSIFDTGFVPQESSGLIRYRTCGSFEQITYQCEPDKYFIQWGEYESGEKEVYNLSQPYRIFIADFYNNELVGIRHFWAVEPASADTQLYAIGLPNTNTIGYSGTSVGWVCLYRTNLEETPDLNSKIDYAYRRESGIDEPYNNANMSETDGPRFYYNNGISHFVDPDHWQALSAQNPLDWFCDPANLIPLKTNSEYHDSYSADGELYLLKHATDDKYYPYYPNRLKPAEKEFYDAGWSNAAVDGFKFSPKDVNIIGASEFPLASTETFIDHFFDKRHPVIDPSSFDSEAIHNAIISMRQACFLTGQYASEENRVIPLLLFDISSIDPETNEISRLTKDQANNWSFFYDGSTVNIVAHDFSPDKKVYSLVDGEHFSQSYIATNSIFSNQYHVLSLPSSEEDLDKQNPSFDEVALFTREAYAHLVDHNNEVNQDFLQQIEDYAHKFGISYYVKSVPNFYLTQNENIYNPVWTPSQALIYCNYCGLESSQNLENVHDFSFHYNPKPINYPDDLDLSYTYVPRSCDRCLNCVSGLTHFFNNLVSNYVTFDVFSLHGLSLSDAKQKLSEQSIATQKIYSFDNRFISFDSDDLYLVITSNVYGTLNFSIVSDQETIEALPSCACGFALHDNEDYTQVEGVDKPVCSSTCYIKSTNTYVQVFSQE